MLSLALAALLLLPDPHSAGRALSQPATHEVASVRIVIDANTQYQTMDGFGSTQRVWRDAHLAGPDLFGPSPIIPQAAQETILTQLYAELGLTRVRTAAIRFSATPARAGYPGDVDGAIAYVKQSMVYGLRTVISENNPTDLLTAADIKMHAENTLALLLHWRAKGLEPPYQTLMNEPTQTRSWADGSWHRGVIRELGPAMRAAGLKTMLMIPDELNACRAYPTAKMVLEDPQARQYVGALAYHMYEGTNACLAAMAELSRAYRLPVWMTEYSGKPGFEDSLEWAKQIHDLIVNYRVSAIDYMFGFFGDYTVSSHFEALIQVAFGPRAMYAGHRRTSKYYTTGQYSRFVRPGDVRIGVASDDAHVYVSAYRGAGKIAIVLINDNPHERPIMVMAKAGPLPVSVAGVRTDRFAQWQPVGPIRRVGSAFPAILPPKSVTTFWGDDRVPSRTTP